MKRITLVLIAFLLTGCATVPNVQELTTAFEAYGEPVPSDTIIAEVSSIEDHATDLQAPCTLNSKCIAPLWYTYRARVRRVLTGQQLGQQISFANLQHDGFETAVKEQLFVFLTPADPATRARLKVEFVASRVLFRLPGRNNWGGG